MKLLYSNLWNITVLLVLLQKIVVVKNQIDIILSESQIN